MKNKGWLIRLGLVVVLLVVGFFIYNGTKDNANNTDVDKEKSQPIAYEILDESVELNEEVDKWLESNLDKEGFYTKKTDKEIFVLISGGIQETTGYGISLNAVNQEGQTIHVEYEVIAPSKSEEVEKKETTPHMILRVDSKDAKVDGEVAPLHAQDESKIEEGK